MTGALPFTREELADMLPVYNMIDDCIAGSHKIKAATTQYLPKPNPSDLSDANTYRYNQYVQRAVFHNVTGRTLSGLVGTLFLREPTIQLPSDLQVLTASVNGVELGLAQLARRASMATLAHGRAGIFTDFPQLDSPVTVDQKGDATTPIIRVHSPQSILNWKVGYRNGRKILRMVVLHEKIDANLSSLDEFTPTFQVNSYRILYLDNDVYRVRYWVESSDGITDTVPRDSNGLPFNEIPFTFIGSENNDELVDVPPMAAIAELNLGHYRCSADYYEGCYIAGQPTTVITGLTQGWISEVFNDQPIRLGARQAIALPAGADAKLVQAAPNTMPFEAMQMLEREMVALGAQIVQQQSVQRTAKEATLESSSDTSILGNVANNVSEAMETALKFACRFSGSNANEVEFKINTDLGFITMSAQDRQELISEWNASAISFNEMRMKLRQAGVASDDDALVQAEGEQKQLQKQQEQMDMLEATAAAKGNPTNNKPPVKE